MPVQCSNGYFPLFACALLANICPGVHPAQGDFGLAVALAAVGADFPAGEALGQPGQGLVAGVADGFLPVGILLRPRIGQAAGHQAGEFVGDQFA